MVYYLTARLGFLMALPPGNVTALWPPSGVALAAVLICGWPASLGVFIGSFFVNLGSLSGAAGLPTAAAIAAGSTLQAWLGAWLLRRFIGILPPQTPAAVVRSIAILFLVSLTAPLVGVTSLCLARFAPWSSYPELLLTWWLGDLIGILVFTPILVVGFKFWNKEKVSQPLLWAIPSFIIGVSLFAFLSIRNYDRQQINADFQSGVDDIVSVLQEAIARELQDLVAVRAFYNASQDVTASEFNTFTTPLLDNSAVASGLEWIPQVKLADRQAFEQAIRQQGFENFSIYQKDAQGNNVPASERPEYFPVTLINPFEPNQVAFGFDLGSNPARLETIQSARDSGGPAATAPIQLVQEKTTQPGILIIMPVYQSGAPTTSVEQRRANLAGLTLGVYRVNVLVQKALEKINRKDIEFTLYDAGDPANPQYLTFYPSISGAQQPPTMSPNLTEAQNEAAYSTTIAVGNRLWLLVARPGPAFAAHTGAWIEWASLLAGLLLAGAFLAFVANRQKTEAAVARSEARYRVIAENTNDVIWVLDLAAQKYVYISPSIEKLLGYTSEEVMHGDMEKIFTPEAFERSNPVLMLRLAAFQADRAQNSFNIEMEQLHKDGSIVPTETTTNFVFNEAGVVQAVGITRDIRERRAAQDIQREQRELLEYQYQALRSSEEKFSRAFLSSPDSIIISTQDEGRYLEVNDSFLRDTGYSREEIIGYTSIERNIWATPKDRDRLLQGLQAQGFVRNLDAQFRRKSGEVRDALISAETIKIGNGKKHLLAVVRDVTEKRRMELALGERVKELTCLFQVNRLLENRQDAIENICHEILEILGPAMQFPQSAAPILELDSQRYLSSQFDDSLSQHLDAAIEVAGLRRGRLSVYYTTDLPFIIPEEQTLLDNITRMLGLWLEQREAEAAMHAAQRDLEELNRKLEERVEQRAAELRESRDQLSAANTALEKAARLKDEFLASMSHELRTPLTSILGLAEVLQMPSYGAMSDKQLRAVQNIDSSGRHLLELINDVLDLSKIEADRLDLQLELCSVADACQASLQLTKGMAHQKRQQVSFSDDLMDARVQADPRRLKQMLVNLLSNAIKFTPSGGLLGLDVTGNAEEQVIFLAVWDRGIGIRPEDMGKLFRPFTQLDNSLSRQTPGTGLGLSLVAKLAEMHGGSIRVESALGEGSRFTLCLPWEAPAATKPEAELQTNPENAAIPPVAPAATMKGTLIVTDDDELILDTLTDHLSALGYQLYKAHDGIELVELTQVVRADVILTDIQMPGMDGLQAIRQIRASGDPHLMQVPIIAITALAMTGDEQICLDAGASRYISKPVSLVKLGKIIEELIEGSST